MPLKLCKKPASQPMHGLWRGCLRTSVFSYHIGEQLRCPLYYKKKIHDERLDARVDSMLEEGLIEELLNFHEAHNKQRIKNGQPPDYTKGIFQTLGFKEFHEYLILSEENKNTDAGRKLLNQSIENMKIATKRYGRRQNKMVRGRFLNIPRREVPPIFELDTTHLCKWEEKVKNKAIHIIESLVKGIPCIYEPIKQVPEETSTIDSHSSNYCDVCERLIIGDKQYAIHLDSNRHKKWLKRKIQLSEKKME